MRSAAKFFDTRTPSLTVPRVLAALLLLGAGWLAACGPSDPIAEIEEARAHYSAELVSFSVAQTPQPPQTQTAPDGGEAMVDDGAAPDGMAAEEGGTAADGMEEDGEMAAAPVEVRSDVILDILMRYDGHDPLPGVTVDITHADVDRHEKGVYRIYLDTSDVHRGPPAQMTPRLEDVPFEEGDQFSAEVRGPIPAGERSEYRELSEIGEGS